jgi:hypothetical protein
MAGAGVDCEIGTGGVVGIGPIGGAAAELPSAGGGV